MHCLYTAYYAARWICSGRSFRLISLASASLRETSGRQKGKQKHARNSASQSGSRKRQKGMRVAIEGCCHGELDAIYATLQELERQQKTKIDLLICCGDFQAVRNQDDLECLAAPPKYRELQTFHKYYSGQAKAPYPTLFIGGNHEACNYLWELYYGGWAAPNIYYLGHAGVVNFGGVRIGGLSGTYQSHHYHLGHFEGAPYNDRTIRSAYHLRELEVFRMRQLKQPLDVMLTHDWPDGIAFHGNFQELFQRKRHLRAEIERGELGSKPGKQLLTELQPKYWFAAHYHVKFPALVRHPQPPAAGGPDAINSLSDKFTSFLALDKCLPGRRFLQLVDFPEAGGPLEFSYDEEWLSILHSTHNLLSLNRQAKPLPGMGGSRSESTLASQEHVRQVLAERGGPKVPHNFAQTAAPLDPRAPKRRGRMPQTAPRNPQTVDFLEMLLLPYNLDHAAAARGPGPQVAVANPEEIDLGDWNGEAASNPEEIDLGNEEGKDDNPEEIDLDDVISEDEGHSSAPI